MYDGKDLLDGMRGVYLQPDAQHLQARPEAHDV